MRRTGTGSGRRIGRTSAPLFLRFLLVFCTLGIIYHLQTSLSVFVDSDGVMDAPDHHMIDRDAPERGLSDKTKVRGDNDGDDNTMGRTKHQMSKKTRSEKRRDRKAAKAAKSDKAATETEPPEPIITDPAKMTANQKAKMERLRIAGTSQRPPPAATTEKPMEAATEAEQQKDVADENIEKEDSVAGNEDKESQEAEDEDDADQKDSNEADDEDNNDNEEEDDDEINNDNKAEEQKTDFQPGEVTIPKVFLTEMGQHDFDPLPLTESKIVWLDAMGGSDDSQDKISHECFLSSSYWKKLAHGAKHYTLTAEMACRKPGDGNKFSRPRTVVIRTETRKPHKSGSKKLKAIRDLISKESEGSLKSQQFFFRRLLGNNWTKEQVHDHFCAPMGVVDFSIDFLNSTKPNPFQALELGGRIRSERSKLMPGWVRTELYEFMPGKTLEAKLKHTNFFTERRRLKLLKDFVGLTRQMYRQQLAHCDMAIAHAMVVEKEPDGTEAANFTEDDDFTLRLFDFERISTSTSGRQQKGQLWQLLGMIGTACGWPNKVKKREGRLHRYDVSSKVCYEKKLWVDQQIFESQIVPDLQKCPFVQPLNWTSRMLEDTEYAYEQLSALVGIDGT